MLSRAIYNRAASTRVAARKPARAFTRPTPSANRVVVRRYATEPGVRAKKLKLTFATPYEVIFSGEVDQVMLPASDGYMTATPNAAQLVTQMQPGLVRFKSEDKDEKYFVSGGFAIITKKSECNITAGEAVLFDDLDLDLVRSMQSKAQSQLSAGSEAERTIARIQFDTASAVLKVLPLVQK